MRDAEIDAARRGALTARVGQQPPGRPPVRAVLVATCARIEVVDDEGGELRSADTPPSLQRVHPKASESEDEVERNLLEPRKQQEAAQGLVDAFVWILIIGVEQLPNELGR